MLIKQNDCFVNPFSTNIGIFKKKHPFSPFFFPLTPSPFPLALYPKLSIFSLTTVSICSKKELNGNIKNEAGEQMVKQIIQYPVPLVLKDILKEKTRGELVVKGENFLKSLFFEDGHLIFAKTDVIEERLGEILFKIGKIDQPQFGEILKLVKSKTGSDRLGKILVQKKILSQRDLFFALLYQLRTIATSTFSLSTGEWKFIKKAPDVPEDSRFNIELPGIIAEGANRIGNFAYFKNKFLYLVPNIKAVPLEMADILSTYEMNFYKSLEAFDGMTCEQIMRQVDMSEDMFWKKIIFFHLLDIVEFIDTSVDEELDKNVEEIFGLYERIKSDKIDYYELLGAAKSATPNEIKDAYFNRAKRYHPDRIGGVPDPEIKEKANFVFAEMNKAYSTLGDENKRRDYDGRGYKEENIDDAVSENMRERAKMLYRKGKVLYTQKKYWEAASVLDESVALDKTKPAYFLLLGMCQMNIPSLKRMAEKHLQKVLESEPWNVDALVSLGQLFLSIDQVNRAEGFFRKAISFNPDHAIARKKLMEILGSKTDGKKKGFSFFGKSKK